MRTPRHPLVGLLLWLLLLAACGPASEPVATTTPPESLASAVVLEPEVPPEATTPTARRRGLWVLCEGSQRVLEHPERIPELIADARALGATDLFVQVYRRGVAWFPSSRADSSPYQRIQQAHGRDTLRELMEAAHQNGLRVHAWVNALSLARNANAAVIADLGRDVVLTDHHGRSLLDYPDYDVPPPDRRLLRVGTPGIYLDPGAPGLAEYVADTFGELVRQYPELDGLHLDYTRYPDVLPFSPGSRFGVGLHFGYGEATRARFRAETGLVAPFGDSLGNANAWDDWRRDQVTLLVSRIAEAARLERPGIEISAAVWAYPDRAYLALFQDWRTWLVAGHLDLAVPMLYTLDDRLLAYSSRAFAGGVEGGRILAGLGSWLFARSPERAAAQVRIVVESGLAGDALFSWDSIAESPALLSALREDGAGGS